MKKDNINNVSENLNWNLVSKYRTELMGIAAIFILICHVVQKDAQGREYCYALLNNYGGISYVLSIFFNQLDIGVDIFLFVSGVGLYYSYEKKPDFRDYYSKRLVNVYVITAIITFVFSLPNFLFFHSVALKDFLLGVFSIKWTLGVGNSNWYISFLMIMYLVFPLIYKFVKLIETKTYARLIIACIVVVYGVALWFVCKTVIYEKYNLGLFRIPIFFVGCYSGYLAKNNKDITWIPYVLGIIGIVFKIISIRIFPEYPVLNRMSYFFLFYLFLLVSIFCLKKSPLFLLKFFRFMGGMSLELYLIHANIRSFVQTNYFEYCNLFTYIITVFAAIPISYAFSKLRILIVNKYNNHIKNQIKIDS